MKYSDGASELLNSVRSDISAVMVRVDEFIDKTDKRIKDKEAELDERLKASSTLKIRERKLKKDIAEFETSKGLVNKQKEANREKQLALKRKEEELDKKLERVKNILS